MVMLKFQLMQNAVDVYVLYMAALTSRYYHRWINIYSKCIIILPIVKSSFLLQVPYNIAYLIDLSIDVHYV